MQATDKRVGRYILLEPLGRGAMGTVYRAEDPFIHRMVAVKVLRAEEGLTPRQVEISRERFQREAEAAGRIDHPNVIRIFDVGQDDPSGELYIVMEFVSGPSLEKLLDEGGFDCVRGVEIIGQIAAGLDAAHKRGILHRDIKPSNILFTEDGIAKIVDFGITRIGTSFLTQDMRMLGTPAYMSPEQVQGHELDARSDLFSLGVVSHEILAGRKPFGGSNAVSVAYAIAHGQPRLISEVNSSLPSTLDAPFERMLSKSPSARFPSGQEFADAVRRCLSEKMASRVPTPTDTETRLGRSLLPLGGIAGIVLAIALGLFVMRPSTGDVEEPQAAPQAVPTAAPKAAPKGAPKGTPKAAPKGTPKAGPRAGPKAVSKGAPNAGPIAAPLAAPNAGPIAAPIAAPSAVPKPAAQSSAAPPAELTISLAHRIRRGTLIVSLDGEPIFSETFSKDKLVLRQTTTWDPLRAPSGEHTLTARVDGEDGETYLLDPYPVELARDGNIQLRFGLKRDKLTVVSSPASR